MVAGSSTASNDFYYSVDNDFKETASPIESFIVSLNGMHSGFNPYLLGLKLLSSTEFVVAVDGDCCDAVILKVTIAGSG